VARDIVLSIEIHREPKTVYDTIASRSGLASFWTPDVEGDESTGGELTFGFAEAPVRLPIRVVRLEAPSEIGWDCLGAFPFWEGTTVDWALSSSDHGTKVIFRHLGFSEEMPEYEFGSIAQTWGSIVARLKEVVESGGAPNPALR
jgi:uncharacterized protein YndB with AHSA1/START domain